MDDHEHGPPDCNISAFFGAPHVGGAPTPGSILEV